MTRNKQVLSKWLESFLVERANEKCIDLNQVEQALRVMGFQCTSIGTASSVQAAAYEQPETNEPESNVARALGPPASGAPASSAGASDLLAVGQPTAGPPASGASASSERASDPPAAGQAAAGPPAAGQPAAKSRGGERGSHRGESGRRCQSGEKRLRDGADSSCGEVAPC